MVLAPDDFLARDRTLLASLPASRKLETIESALAKIAPAVRVKSEVELRVLPRVKPGRTAIHLVNWAYSPDRDTIETAKDVRLTLNLSALGIPDAKRATVFAPDRPTLKIEITDGSLVIPQLGLWAVVEIGLE